MAENEPLTKEQSTSLVRIAEEEISKVDVRTTGGRMWKWELIGFREGVMTTSGIERSTDTALQLIVDKAVRQSLLEGEEKESVIVTTEKRAEIMLDKVRRLERANPMGYSDSVLQAVRQTLECVLKPGLLGAAIDTPSGRLTFYFGAKQAESAKDQQINTVEVEAGMVQISFDPDAKRITSDFNTPGDIK